MYIKLDLCDVDFIFKVDAESLITLKMHSEYINYEIERYAIFEESDIYFIRDTINNALNNKMEQSCCKVIGVEPDIEFNIYKEKELVAGENGVLYVAPGYEKVDCSMDMIIYFWCKDGALGSNFFNLSFNKEEMYVFYQYFRLITKEINENDENIRKLIEEGKLILED